MSPRPLVLFRISQLLLLLAFISKISLQFIGVPYQFSYFIFQYGLHPFVNFVLVAVLSPFAIFHWRRWKDRPQQHPFYTFFVRLLAVVLSLQTLFQMIFLNSENSVWMQGAALAFALLLIFVYGVIIPAVLKPEEFFGLVLKTSVFLTLFSLVLWLINAPGIYKGNRFIGTFKHIPHMVTCSTIASIFYLPKLFDFSVGFFRRLFRGGIFLLLIFAIVLTGTRTSILAAGLAFLIGIFILQKGSARAQLFRILMAGIFVSFFTFFGAETYDYLRGLAKGEVSLGQREAQDGFASRWEEVERGLEIAQESPHIGLGLLSKFNSSEDASVETYNSFKDPHNIFVSALVIGGWPLAVVTFLGLAGLFFGAIKGLRLSPQVSIVALYLLTHLPILIIYHWHFSIGGLADRFYWMAFGLLATQLYVKKVQTHS